MGIARSTYYDPLENVADDTAIVEAMFSISDEFEFYGYRRVGAALRQQGLVVNHKKIRASMICSPGSGGASWPPPTAIMMARSSQPGLGHRSNRPEPALRLRHNLRRAADPLRLHRSHSRRLVPHARRLRH